VVTSGALKNTIDASVSSRRFSRSGCAWYSMTTASTNCWAVEPGRP
jgi:hypothetical protein